MVVRAAGNNFVPPLHERARHGLGVSDHLLLIIDELRIHGLFKSHGLGRNHVHQRPALGAGKHCAVQLFVQGFVPVGENNATAGAAQGLVGGGGHHIGIGHG